MRISVFLIAASLGVVACSSNKAPAPPAATAAQPAQPLPNSNVFSSDIRALEKAKAVQGVVDKQAQDANKKLDDAGG